MAIVALSRQQAAAALVAVLRAAAIWSCVAMPAGNSNSGPRTMSTCSVARVSG